MRSGSSTRSFDGSSHTRHSCACVRPLNLSLSKPLTIGHKHTGRTDFSPQIWHKLGLENDRTLSDRGKDTGRLSTTTCVKQQHHKHWFIALVCVRKCIFRKNQRFLRSRRTGAGAGDVSARRSYGSFRKYTVTICGSARSHESFLAGDIGFGLSQGRSMVHEAPFGSTTRNRSIRGWIALRNKVRILFKFFNAFGKTVSLESCSAPAAQTPSVSNYPDQTLFTVTLEKLLSWCQVSCAQK